ncbi:glycosyltransferase family 2 protein [Thioclava sp. FR2]|uniref:glycosyltransferase family 2 protein n=1 Tax=Thioclava sp. FR2 TaxID=3445780 RepID=UPI003EB7B3A6
MTAEILPLVVPSGHDVLPGIVPTPNESLPVALLRAGKISGDQMVLALAIQSRRNSRIADVLLSRGMVTQEELFATLADQWSCDLVDPQDLDLDTRLIDRLGAMACLRRQILPIRQHGDITLIATARPEDFGPQRDQLTRLFGPVAMAIASPAAIEEAILRNRGRGLAKAAESRVPALESCRDLAGPQIVLPVLLLLLGLAIVTLVKPAAVLWVLMAWAVVTLFLSAALKLAAGTATLLRKRGGQTDTDPKPVQIARLPVVSAMVPLYREADIAPRLIRRLSRLDYPQELLDIVLVAEANDHLTRQALAATDLPPWMRVVVVPDGPLKTKPRALNFALDHCRGTIIGVYDAEDAPDPDQINRIVDRFHNRGPEVACLQGILDFYNPTTNWLSRCFTIEYATWFRLVLPGLERLGLCVPLGGTTLFFRRSVLEELGGWDAHNVTEDADLGMRLCRHGYRTEVIETVTKEEANCRALPWVKQRSRWLKGYMMTWATHMRNPGVLLHELGLWRFAGFQVLFLCTLSQFLLMPLLWGLWVFGMVFGQIGLFADFPGLALAITLLFGLSELANLSFGLIGLRRSGQSLSPFWVPTLSLYFPLGALASYKALWEVVRNPFYWDKTSHGKFDDTAA